ncbi:MAG: hypothetical protein CL920_04455 [Deltaproteobacteria bacterium]|mgnify:CR=1 FL=1|nr:hypothetical protein [Deltaproteobacteria bacterium]MBU47929.1 hypothetical protein [Deltaproteobacteria bacterium]|tara:strand:+ start:1656 stop:2108 length:453 start_codon:yes stop_codon:yes gene_type:complete
MYTLIYKSTHSGDIDWSALQAMLAKSRKHNQLKQITGMLLVTKREFFQLLEGEEETIEALYERIQQDPRHTEIVTLSRQTTPTRFFPDWYMRGVGIFDMSPEFTQMLYKTYGQDHGALTLPTTEEASYQLIEQLKLELFAMDERQRQQNP